MAIALFQFHAAFDLCRARVALLRRLNPGVSIFGLYGGASSDLGEASALTAVGLADIYHARPEASARSQWKDTDLAVVDWFRHVGRSLSFDRVHVVQWDLLFFAPLDRVYPSLPAGSVALSGLVPLERIAHFWDWTAGSTLLPESERLFSEARQRFGYAGVPHACVGPGYSLSRSFLEGYSELEVSDAGHDELRLPLFAQILGAELVDTGFYPRWRDPEVERVFNADPKEIDPAIVESELRRPNGRRVFHPCRERFDTLTIESLLALTTR